MRSKLIFEELDELGAITKIRKNTFIPVSGLKANNLCR